MRVEPHDPAIFCAHMLSLLVIVSLSETEYFRHQIVNAAAMIAHMRRHMITARG